jgi:hypothetical protein
MYLALVVDLVPVAVAAEDSNNLKTGGKKWQQQKY